jgi:hypothetical protein
MSGEPYFEKAQGEALCASARFSTSNTGLLQIRMHNRPHSLQAEMTLHSALGERNIRLIAQNTYCKRN